MDGTFTCLTSLAADADYDQLNGVSLVKPKLRRVQSRYTTMMELMMTPTKLEPRVLKASPMTRLMRVPKHFQIVMIHHAHRFRCHRPTATTMYSKPNAATAIPAASPSTIPTWKPTRLDSTPIEPRSNASRTTRAPMRPS